MLTNRLEQPKIRKPPGPFTSQNIYANLQVNVKESVWTDLFRTDIILPFKTFHTGRSTLIVKVNTFSKDQMVNNQFLETLSTSWNDVVFS